jgi:hypothetical protein
MLKLGNGADGSTRSRIEHSLSHQCKMAELTLVSSKSKRWTLWPRVQCSLGASGISALWIKPGTLQVLLKKLSFLHLRRTPTVLNVSQHVRPCHNTGPATLWIWNGPWHYWEVVEPLGSGARGQKLGHRKSPLRGFWNCAIPSLCLLHPGYYEVGRA